LRHVSNHWFKPVHELRKNTGLPKSSYNPLMKSFSTDGNLALFPKEFAAPQKDWPVKTFQPGFPLFADTDKPLSGKVSEFLNKGEAPIVFTLGTAVVQMKSDFFKIAYKAVKQTGIRAIFLTGENPDHVNDEMSGMIKFVFLLMNHFRIYFQSAGDCSSMRYRHYVTSAFIR
jgi:rhamnosyltransferase subunit B